ncbi:MAG: hypothetical protein HY701_04380 [Gemmatimonadetes bacterium]|nr:hypothetical protein [Gemmatimonadota bacterium]
MASRAAFYLEPFQSDSGRGFVVCRSQDDQRLNWRTLPRSEGIESMLVVGEQYRIENLQDPSFAAGEPLALVPEPGNHHDPNAVAVWNADRTLQAGYVPREAAPAISERLLRGDPIRCICLWESLENERRTGIRLLLCSADAVITLAPSPAPARSSARRVALDEHRQPGAAVNVHRRLDRDIHEMLGLARGVLFDGEVTEAEAIALGNWLAPRQEILNVWPADILAHRLQRIFADGRVDPNERKDLKQLLEQLVGGDCSILTHAPLATAPPLDDPPPPLSFSGQTYVFTGKFAYGPRSACEHEVVTRGGICKNSVTKRTNVLVIGTFGSTDWAHTAYGRKIERAVAYKRDGVPVAIVAEDHWAAVLG